MEAHATSLPLTHPRRLHGRSLTLVQGVLLAAAAVVCILTAPSARWDLVSLILIALLAVVGDVTSVETGSSRVKVSASFLGLMLAAVVLGGPPAALIGILTIVFGWLR